MLSVLPTAILILALVAKLTTAQSNPNPILTSSFTWNGYCGPSVACGPSFAGIAGQGAAAANNVTYAAGQEIVGGKGAGCGQCWHLQPQTDAFPDNNGLSLGTPVVIKITDQCTDAGYCDQTDTRPLNTGYGKQVHFDLCNVTGVTEQFFGAIGPGVILGLAQMLPDCSALDDGPFGSNLGTLGGATGGTETTGEASSAAPAATRMTPMADADASAATSSTPAINTDPAATSSTPVIPSLPPAAATSSTPAAIAAPAATSSTPVIPNPPPAAATSSIPAAIAASAATSSTPTDTNPPPAAATSSIPAAIAAPSATSSTPIANADAPAATSSTPTDTIPPPAAAATSPSNTQTTEPTQPSQATAQAAAAAASSSPPYLNTTFGSVGQKEAQHQVPSNAAAAAAAPAPAPYLNTTLKTTPGGSSGPLAPAPHYLNTTFNSQHHRVPSPSVLSSSVSAKKKKKNKKKCGS
ncbi:ADAM metallopeptidase with thrombospondin type 1, motif [Mycoblastus sanguinarius]|nr:ADAM metallopeptidase with thrombospondin type 1, motif [Mycoblastus sanguinarius]